MPKAASKTVSLGPDELVIRRSILKDLQLQLRELQKRENREYQQLDRQIAGLLGEIKPRPRLERIESRTGVASKCAEIRKRIEPIN